MRLVLVADTFPPLRTSSAVQLRDLALEFVRQGHTLTVLLPATGLTVPWSLEDFHGVQVLRLRAPNTKDINYVSRTINEILMPLAMLHNFRKTTLAKERWDGVLWYSPSIFFGLIVKSLKKASACRGYLIIRDIFPEWAADVGLMGRGLPYRFLKAVANYQYSVADVIGVQSPGNEVYFENWRQGSSRKLEVLQNWLADAHVVGCSLEIAKTPLAGRKVFVYAGNMGVAQGVGIFLDLAEKLINQSDVGFLFVGRGSDFRKLAVYAKVRGLRNVLCQDEIHPDEIPGLYSQCRVGLIALDHRHKTHNIPGKFLTYMQNGLPVLANINLGNDLAKIIKDERIGQVCESNQLNEMLILTEKLLAQIEADPDLGNRCKHLFARKFQVDIAVKQIVNALTIEHVVET